MGSVLLSMTYLFGNGGGNKFLVTEDKGYLKCLCGNHFIRFIYFRSNFLQTKENGIMIFL